LDQEHQLSPRRLALLNITFAPVVITLPSASASLWSPVDSFPSRAPAWSSLAA